MTKRPTISLFRKTPKAAEPVCAVVAQIPIRYVSRKAIEQLVASFNKTAAGAE